MVPELALLGAVMLLFLSAARAVFWSSRVCQGSTCAHPRAYCSLHLVSRILYIELILSVLISLLLAMLELAPSCHETASKIEAEKLGVLVIPLHKTGYPI